MIELIQVHESIVAAKKLKIQYKSNRVLFSREKNKIKDIEKEIGDKIEDIEKLTVDITALKLANIPMQ